MNVVELCKSNIIKKKLVKILCDEIENLTQIDLTNKIWNDIKKGGKLVEDEEMNLLTYSMRKTSLKYFLNKK